MRRTLGRERAADVAKASELSARGWRVTCTCCGMTEYYEPGTTMRGIGFST
ncbi:MAG TPA: hypothetical protein VLV86_21490 [Vicinamibacterales bacterium]|nr:hypothetical protein [Vicinamibacterales bacterium]